MVARACSSYQYPAYSISKNPGDRVTAKFQIKNCGFERGNFFLRILKDGRECDGKFNTWLDVGEYSTVLNCTFTVPSVSVELKFIAGHAEGGVWRDDIEHTVTIMILECTTGCEVSCQTMCESSCQNTCEKACQNSCEFSCQTPCEASCQTSCELSCQSGCEVNCQSTCQVSCQTDCELGCLSCQLGCQLFCQDACQSECQTICETACEEACEISCQAACETACQTNCEETCQESCQTHCETSCEIACQHMCQTTCEESCEDICQVGCQVACESLCEKGCETGCEIVCEVMCQNACEKDCQISCEVRCEESCELACQTACELKCETNCEESCEASCQTACEIGCQTACEIACQLTEEGGDVKDTRLIVDDIEAIIEEPIGIKVKLQSKNLIWHDLTNAEVHVSLDGEPLASKLTDKNGEVTIPYTPGVAGNFTIKAVFDGYEDTYAPCESTGTLSIKGFSMTYSIENGVVTFNGICTLKLPRDYVRLYHPDVGRDTIVVDSIPVSTDGSFTCTIPEPEKRTTYYACRCWAQLDICEWTLDCGDGAVKTQDVLVIPTGDEGGSVIDVLIDTLVSALGITEAQAKTILLGGIVISGLMLFVSVKGALK